MQVALIYIYIYDKSVNMYNYKLKREKFIFLNVVFSQSICS
jgi:hypothetical protein